MKNAFKKIIILLVLVITFEFIFSNVGIYAMVNTDYFNMEEYSDASDADDYSINEEPGALVGLISLAFLEVGRMIESIVGWLMGLFGPEIFPWADFIIFNCVPILDVNFINPSTKALFGSDFAGGSVGTVLRNIYFTGLSIAIGFLGIVVAVMAIKMAISTIASEKARYKEGIVTLLTTLVLLFGCHYLLSFTFYLNEKMVEVASRIVSSISVENANVGSGNASAMNGIVSGLGDYFYEMAKAQGGEVDLLIAKIDKAAPIPTILYLVFLIQSIMFLFSYFKRLFYVAILSIIAPFVVIFDFLGKSVSL